MNRLILLVALLGITSSVKAAVVYELTQEEFTGEEVIAGTAFGSTVRAGGPDVGINRSRQLLIGPTIFPDDREDESTHIFTYEVEEEYSITYQGGLLTQRLGADSVSYRPTEYFDELLFGVSTNGSYAGNTVTFGPGTFTSDGESFNTLGFIVEGPSNFEGLGITEIEDPEDFEFSGSIKLHAFEPGFDFTSSDFLVQAVGYDNPTVENVSVPEPSTGIWVGLALLGLGMRRRRLRRSAK